MLCELLFWHWKIERLTIFIQCSFAVDYSFILLPPSLPVLSCRLFFFRTLSCLICFYYKCQTMSSLNTSGSAFSISLLAFASISLNVFKIDRRVFQFSSSICPIQNNLCVQNINIRYPQERGQAEAQEKTKNKKSTHTHTVHVYESVCQTEMLTLSLWWGCS